ncbi:Asp-tRNA(Asn)/Glu-tRNA(Gln) amidotransferase subunit GatB [Legionella sp. CNM-4043-24]|uniref:Asp-tRNA(Asn)/Glu-tRNA(Gln) amidotransferase subunit GatB n=1 Tax=Legionella sp. CNM-4043-24 TaxID=3421646 RepID=UPI00403AD062
MAWDTVIGLEVHAQLSTRSKLFSAASTEFGRAPNSHTSYIDAGFPGTLPVLNREAVRMAIQFGLAIQAGINSDSYFERKNYFYPDLPKGYQISQFQRPIVGKGELSFDMPSGQRKTVSIVRAHLEEDAGKSLHDQRMGMTGVDLNRAGTPLLEIVTAPCLYSADEVIHYLRELRQLLRFLGICDGNMQEGSFRCDVNISLKPAGSSTLGVRTELKNLNSFRFIEKAIAFEQARHQDILEQNRQPVQETRLFCTVTETTQSMRSKENEHDYRYFPDPDLLPIAISAEDIARVRASMPPLPAEIRSSLCEDTRLLDDDVLFLLSEPAVYHFFLKVQAHSQADNKTIVNWMKGLYTAALNESGLSFEAAPLPAELLGSLLNHVHSKTLSNASAKQIFTRLWAGERNLDELVNQENAGKIQDSDQLSALIQSLIQQYPQQAEEYRQGKEKLLAFFVGQVMKASKGQANPEVLSELLKQALI